MTIAAVVVTYLPTEAALTRLLVTLSPQVNHVIVVDNTPAASSSWLNEKWFAPAGHAVSYVPLGENAGIAKAQNIGVRHALQAGCDHVIFFDQDSALPPTMLAALLAGEHALLERGERVGAVGPIFLDEKTREYSPAIRHAGMRVVRFKIAPNTELPVEADYLISSGSLIRASVLAEIGGMRDELFIDWVDIEWGLRAGHSGFKHYIIPQAVMLHSIGDEYQEVAGRKINLHNDVRNYYIVRNACYLLRDPCLKWQWRTSIFFKIPQYVFFYSFTSLSGQRGKAFLLLLRACRDGFAARLGKAF